MNRLLIIDCARLCANTQRASKQLFVMSQTAFGLSKQSISLLLIVPSLAVTAYGLSRTMR